MTTRQKVLALASELGATIEDDAAGFAKHVNIIAPEGHHWNDGEIHELVGSYYTHKAEVWDDLLGRMGTGVETCNEHCDYWEE
jgi:hypothetical protein